MINKLNKSACAIFLLLTVLIGCKKEPVLSDLNNLLEFRLEAQYNNDFLKKDISGKIYNSKITLSIPRGMNLTNLTATFSHNGKRILINGTEQRSTVTRNDFSKDLRYLIEAENGNKVTYSIKIEEFDDISLIFKDFSFNKKDNPDLKIDYVFNQEEEHFSGRVDHSFKELIASFETGTSDVRVNGIKQESGKTINDFSSPVTYTLTSEYGITKEYIITVEWKTGIPHIYIMTDGNTPITSKDNYLSASITIDGKGVYESYEGRTNIRGRGNSTWGLPKKPYRLKLDKKSSILGLKEEKDWVLLANYLDETLMLNAVAMKVGQQLQMPYTNTIIPVEITINGNYLGNYMLTEQIEVEKTRVNIEDGGTLLELDSYFDEDWKFKSSFYELPVMIKYPKLEDYPIDDANSELTNIITDFQRLEDAIKSTDFPNTNYLEYIDIEAFVYYFIVYNLTANGEINHPKSTYIHKPKNGKYMMGPIWDFDWAFSFDGNNSHFHSYNNPLISNDMSRIGSRFFSRLLTDPKIRTLYKTKWLSYKSNQFPALMKYIDDYADLIKESKQRDYSVWKNGSDDFEQDINKLRSWVKGRAEYMDYYVNNL